MGWEISPGLGEMMNTYRILMENYHLENQGIRRTTIKMNLGEIGFEDKIWE